MWLMRRTGEEDETTWEEHSEFQKDLKLNITVSEFDIEPKVVVYCNEQKNKLHGSDFSAINFLSQYHIHTHQGNRNTRRKVTSSKQLTLAINLELVKANEIDLQNLLANTQYTG